MLKIKFFSIVLLFSFEAWALSPSLIKRIKKEPFPLKNPYASSFWAFCHIDRFKVDSDTYLPADLIIKPNRYIKNEYKLSLHLQKSKAPMAIVIPGSLSNINGKQAQNLSVYLLEQGYHVLTLPNPIGTEYVSLEPFHELGNIEMEALSYLEFIKTAKDYLRNKNLLTNDKIATLSVSYGAFLMSVILNKMPQFFSRNILFAPPINLLHSINVLDNIIKSRKQTFSYFDIISQIPNLFSYCNDKTPIDSKEMAKLSEEIIAFISFQGRFARTLKIHTEKNMSFKSKYYSYFSLLNPSFRSWMKNLLFIENLKKYSPKSFQLLNTPKGELRYWLKDIPQKKYQILTGQNDFVNKNLDWPKDLNKLELNHGSHYGYRVHEWFRDYIKEGLKL
jgi:hypothetical protein